MVIFMYTSITLQLKYGGQLRNAIPHKVQLRFEKRAFFRVPKTNRGASGTALSSFGETPTRHPEYGRGAAALQHKCRTEYSTGAH